MNFRKVFKYKLKGFKRKYLKPIHIAIRNKKKVFCIGLNKTGTTSVEKALSDLGYFTSDESYGQKLLYDYEERKFNKIIRFCKTAEAFQDEPFSNKYTFMFLDNYFNNAKFILTIRDSADEWYNSLVTFHSMKFGKDGRIPTYSDLMNAERPFGRALWDNMKMRYNVSKQDPYNKHTLKKYYYDHNAMVQDYFRGKDNLLVIKLKDKNSYRIMCEYLNKKPIYDDFPWLNKSKK